MAVSVSVISVLGLAQLWAWWDSGHHSSRAGPSVCGDTGGAHHCCHYWPMGPSPQEAVPASPLGNFPEGRSLKTTTKVSDCL